MHEIDCLPPAEQAKVVLFASQLPMKKPPSGGELTALAQRMVDDTDPAAGGRLQEELVKGFYGDEWHAGDSPPSIAKCAHPASVTSDQTT